MRRRPHDSAHVGSARWTSFQKLECRRASKGICDLGHATQRHVGVPLDFAMDHGAVYADFTSDIRLREPAPLLLFCESLLDRASNLGHLTIRAAAARIMPVELHHLLVHNRSRFRRRTP